MIPSGTCRYQSRLVRQAPVYEHTAAAQGALGATEMARPLWGAVVDQAKELICSIATSITIFLI